MREQTGFTGSIKTSVAMNLKRILKWIVVALVALFLGVPLLFVAINAFDEELEPGARAFSDPPTVEVPPEQNAYYAWIGLRAARNENQHVRGKEIVAHVNKQLDIESREIEIIDIDVLLGPSHITSKAPSSELGLLCRRDTQGCLDRYRTKDADIERWVREDKVLLDRYHALYSYAYFRETIKPRPAAPFYSAPATVAALARAQAAQKALRGSPDEALRRLHKDTAFWRRVITDSRLLVNRMIAVASIQTNVQLISEIIATYKLPADKLQIAATAIRPLTNQERDISGVFRYEIALGAYMFAHLDSYAYQTGCDSDSWSACLFEKLSTTSLLKPNATINMSFEKFNRIAQVGKLPAEQFLEQVKQARENDKSGSFIRWHFFYNPIGKLLNTIPGDSLYYSYVGRVHNLDGFLRLASLQMEMKRQGVRDSQVASFLKNAGPNLYNPYTNEPMLWDTKKRSIYFHGMSDKENEELLSKRLEIHL